MIKNWQEWSEALVAKAKKAIWDNQVALEYVKKRGLHKEQVEKYEIGALSREELSSLVPLAAPELRDSEQLQVFLYKWDGIRLVFPIFSVLDYLVAVEYRDVSHHSYFRDALERSLFTESFFGSKQQIETIWKTKLVFVTEGAIDALSFEILFPGIPVLSSHTQTLVQAQVKFLKRFVAKVSLLFDKTSIPQMEQFCESYGGTFAVDFLDWRRNFGLNLIGIKDINELLVQAGEYRAKRFLQDHFVELDF